MKQDITTFRIRRRQNRAQRPAFAFQEPLYAGFSADSPVLNEVVLGTWLIRARRRAGALQDPGLDESNRCEEARRAARKLLPLAARTERASRNRCVLALSCRPLPRRSRTTAPEHVCG